MGVAAALVALPIGPSGAVALESVGASSLDLFGADSGMTPPLGACRLGDPTYYAFDLMPTQTQTRFRRTRGRATVRWSDTPFDVALSPDGHFEYELRVEVTGLSASGSDRVLVVWVATPDLASIRELGALDVSGRSSGVVRFNKFLVFVTVEPPTEASRERWSGPIVLKGMSRSARMQSMAAHGFFEQEPC